MKISEIKVSYINEHSAHLKASSSADAYTIALNNWDKDIIELQEEVKVILLNRANGVVGIYSLSKGGVSSSIVDIKLILSVALKAIATSIILVHNHPSGNLKPSQADLKLTSRLIKATDTVDIKLLDHLIITKESYYSLADEGRLQ
ncbi:JAB domain-containing protein [Mesonia sp. MT50]|uniref:JAB domain-containing protein n=2 Tax=Mesonia TaxID=232115 RepID=A0ABU1A0K8_9FLAO|nr:MULTISPECIES: JAB domain-containing protein [Mesonia]MDQ7917206.1 JAB domain-containing protein [Mesonia profundi]MDT0294089.1 JAB domain-containing protein [Mesonia ostreae]